MLFPQTEASLQPGDPAHFWPVLVVCVASLLLGALLLAGLLRRLAGAPRDPLCALSLGLSGAALVFILLASPVFLWARALQAAPDFHGIFLLLSVVLALAAAALHFRAGLPFPRAASRTALGLGLIALALGLVRLSFVAPLVLPPYSDSVEHYQIVQDLLHPGAPAAAYYTLGMTARYYHFGFHILAGWVAALSSASPTVVLPVLGQMLQVIIPLGVFFLARAGSRSDAAALFGVLLAGWGWRMPGFASNWGKYPALASIAVLPFALGVGWLAAYAPGTRSQKRALMAVALAGGVLTALVHTRAAVLLLLAVASWLAAGVVLRAGTRGRILAAAMCAALLGWAALRTAGDTGLAAMLSPYVRDGWFATLLVLLPAPFALRYTPRAAAAALLFLLLLVLAALTPMPAAFSQLGYETLLDRPFAQTVLFLPLALGGALGFAGLQRSLGQRAGSVAARLWPALAGAFCLLILANAARIADFAPSACCRLVTRDDLAAYAWMPAHLPRRAVILVAVEKLPTQSYGVDGGVWITPLTGFRTEKFPHNLLVDTAEAHAEICRKGASYVYTGGTAARFSVELLASRPRWYRAVFALPGAAIYGVVGCETPSQPPPF